MTADGSGVMANVSDSYSAVVTTSSLAMGMVAFSADSA